MRKDGTVLVTGGAGFIGSHTIEVLLAEGARVRVLDDLSTGNPDNLAGMDVDLRVGDIRDPAALDAAMEGCERVIHLAARISVPDSCADPAGYADTNVVGTVAVFDAARRAGVRQVAYASSCAVYGSLPGLPKREDDPLAPESPYAATKAADEAFGASFSLTLGLPCVGLRYFNVYGPRQDPQGPYAAVIPRFVERALRGEPLPIHGDGEQGRDFVSVRDVARANVLASRVEAAGGAVLNVGGGRMTTINQLARAVLEVVGGPSRIEHQPARVGDVRFSLADVSRAKALLGWEPQADFDVAMRETVEGYRRLLG